MPAHAILSGRQRQHELLVVAGIDPGGPGRDRTAVLGAELDDRKTRLDALAEGQPDFPGRARHRAADLRDGPFEEGVRQSADRGHASPNGIPKSEVIRLEVSPDMSVWITDGSPPVFRRETVGSDNSSATNGSSTTMVAGKKRLPAKP